MATQYGTYTDGTYIYRDGVRSGEYVIDVALTSTAFSGVENTDWKNLHKINNKILFLASSSKLASSSELVSTSYINQ
jgi:hypothetical protein